MINDTRFYFNREQSLDAWVVEILAVINDVMYDVYKQLNEIIDGVLSDVR